jgi:DNA-binding MarR family transcriptional regulator
MSIERQQAESLLEALVSLLRTTRTVAHRAADLSVSATPIALLRLVRDADPRLGDLAEQLRIKPSVASRAVAALEQHGYVTREPDPADARACRVMITDAGREHLAEREDLVLQRLADTFADWTAEDAEHSVRVLQRLEGTVQDWVARIDAGETDEPSADPTPHPRHARTRTTRTTREKTAV